MSPAFIAGIGEYLAEQPREEEPGESDTAAPVRRRRVASTAVDVTADPLPPRRSQARHRPSSTGPRSSSTAITWWPRPTKRSTKYGGPSRRPVPSSSGPATSG